VRPEILEQLVKLVTLEPEHDAEDKVKFKYPHLSCELLTCEVEAIVNSLSESEMLMGMFWAFLDREEAINPLLGSFTSTVLNMLLNHKCSVIFDYVRDKEGFVNLFLNHLGTSAIMDLLLQMVAAPSNDQTRIELAQWFKEQGIVEKLVDFIHPAIDTKKCANASQALCDMLRVSRESLVQMVGPTPLLGTLESDVTIKRLLENMFCTDTPSDVVIVSGVSVLLTAIERRQPNALSPSMNSTFVGDDISATNVQATKAILGVIVPRMKEFHDLLLRIPNVPAMPTSAGLLDPPLGNTRLQVVKLFCSLLQCCDHRVNRRVAELNTFSILMDLFFKFPWNNFLHTQVEGCVSAAVSTASPSPPTSGPDTTPADTPADSSESQTEDSFSLKYHVLHDCHLVQRLLDGDEGNQKLSSESRGRRQGYMGHLIRMVNLLVRCGETDQGLASMLRDTMEEDLQQRWNLFISGTVADTNKKNETNLGGNRPVASSMDDSDDEFDQIVTPDNELDKAYQCYQEVKYISAMIDEFGVDDELRSNEELYSGTFERLMGIGCSMSAEEEQTESTALFEAACAEKIQQFDDSESDEEESSTWADREVTFTSPMDRQSSMSSEEDEGTNRQREFQTSFEEESSKSPQQNRLGATATPAVLSQITGKAGDDSNMMDISSPYSDSTSWQSPDDLSGATPMDTGGEWTTVSESRTDTTPSPPQGNWADFSSFPTHNSQSPQAQKGLENSVHGAVAAAGADSPGGDNSVLSPPRHDTSQYSVIEESPEGAGKDGSGVGVVDMESVELTVMDDIHSSDSPQVVRRAAEENANNSNSSDEDDSSGSEEDRSGRYVINTSSDGEHLLESPGQSPQQSTSVSHGGVL
jgi:hypothetical protein